MQISCSAVAHAHAKKTPVGHIIITYYYSLRMRVWLIPCKVIQECLFFWIPLYGFRIPRNEFQILCQWDLESDFNRWWNFGLLKLYSARLASLANLWCRFTPLSIFLLRGAWSQAKDSGFLEENKNHGIRIPLHVAIRPSVILYIFNIDVWHWE